ncbi:energy-coupling factor transport system ATP-binding protein [Fontibacillus panacisegetis]|uniref:Energy-coupling factor transport system ATP-binding protein n=1 Tax=Fontibacillus panacisegetis TaxID=670482 RepID=A0A1G7JX53_9BACL|nr:ABC transporter ATP-binding protein [Fontibacillus panacisegetis]SDF29516.1 energy-coupling factor transport system ATP-binding protein [Fontibacillus panacisegetis]
MIEINRMHELDEKKHDIVAGVTDLRLKFSGEESRSRVFNDLSLEVRRGEKILLLGPSGCGKSTLLQVLSGIIPELIEAPMRCSSRTIPDSRGIVFQDPDTQFCMPYVDEELAFVLENLSVPREDMSLQMNNALQAVGLVLKDVHVPIDSLSQGMKQRLALASVLLCNPEVIFLDEPSALLDPEGREQIWQAVHKISNNRTLIIVEHRIEELLGLGLVDRVALFGPGGEMLALAPPAEIFKKYKRELIQYGIWYPGVWEDFFRSPSGQLLVSTKIMESGNSQFLNNPIIELEDFCGTRYGKSVVKVERLALYPGDFVAVTGPNGAGKSSLLLSLMSLINTSGSYLLQGQQMVSKKKRKLQIQLSSQHIGFVFQNPEYQFVEDTVGSEIAYSLKETDMSDKELQSKVKQALEQFGLSGLEGRHPFQLSLGQKRRLSVAGTIVLEKSVLLLDEPTFGQDALNTFAILSLCEELRQSGVAIIMVTHEEMIANRLATHRWEVREGTLLQKVTDRGRKLAGVMNEDHHRTMEVMV